MGDDIKELWDAHHEDVRRLDSVEQIVIGMPSKGIDGLVGKVTRLETDVHAMKDAGANTIAGGVKTIVKWALGVVGTMFSAWALFNLPAILENLAEALK